MKEKSIDRSRLQHIKLVYGTSEECWREMRDELVYEVERCWRRIEQLENGNRRLRAELRSEKS